MVVYVGWLCDGPVGFCGCPVWWWGWVVVVEGLVWVVGCGLGDGVSVVVVDVVEFWEFVFSVFPFEVELCAHSFVGGGVVEVVVDG